MKTYEALNLFAEHLTSEIDKKIANGYEFWQATTRDELDVYLYRFIESLSEIEKLSFNTSLDSLLDTFISVVDENTEELTDKGVPLSDCFSLEALKGLFSRAIIEWGGNGDDCNCVELTVSKLR